MTPGLSPHQPETPLYNYHERRWEPVAYLIDQDFSPYLPSDSIAQVEYWRLVGEGAERCVAAALAIGLYLHLEIYGEAGDDAGAAPE